MLHHPRFSLYPEPMKTPFPTALVFALITMIVSACLHAEEKDVSGEPFGKLVLGEKSSAVIKLLGEPKSKGKDANWAAIGEWVQDWNFPSKGITLAMSSEKKGGPKTVYSISATEGCELTTARGIKIGSSEADVVKAYGKEQDKEQTKPGQSFVAGSIYGGVIFTFKGGKVTGIFIGAAAE